MEMLNIYDFRSCWSFSAVASLEGQLFKKRSISIGLSQQNLIDCVYGSLGGCNGGWVDDAFTYIKSNGITNQNEYPVKSRFYLLDNLQLILKLNQLKHI
jgi:hypothetical protein